MKITSFKLHDSNFTMVNKFQRLCVEILKKKPKRFRTKLYVFPALQSPLYPEMKPKNKVESQNWKIQTRDTRVSMIFREFRGGGGGGQEKRTKDLVCILNVDFNYKHRIRDIIFAGKDAGKDAGKGKKLAIAYCRAPTTIPHPEYLKRNPLWIVKQTKTIPSNYFSYSYIFRCLLSSHSRHAISSSFLFHETAKSLVGF